LFSKVCNPFYFAQGQVLRS